MSAITASSLLLILCCAPLIICANRPRATVVDSGSTNTSGLKVTFDGLGNAQVLQSNRSGKHVRLSPELCGDFLRELQAAAPLDRIPARRCMKSASFGSSLYVEFQGKRSPDLSCPGAPDGTYGALQQQARELLNAARKASGVGAARRVY